MERIHAYIDESGAYGFDFSKEANSTHFIITAVTVKESDIPQVEEAVKKLITVFGFKNGEIKSSKIKANYRRRTNLISEIIKLPIKAFILVVDKRKIYKDSGISKNKKVFYKFLNDLLYSELRRNFNKINIEADSTGTNTFQSEFYKYVRSKEQPLSLFDDFQFTMTDSKDSVIVQLADLISGSLSYKYEESKILKAHNIDYRKRLSPIILMLKEFPLEYEKFIEEEVKYDASFNKTIFDIAYRRAQDFINNAKEDDDTIVSEQKFVLEYLMFRFINNKTHRYIGTRELIGALENAGFKRRSIASFRMQIIAKLRDHRVIISSGQQGYKLPSTVEELCEYITHTKTIIMPMISRLKKCIEVVKMGSNGDINLFDLPQYTELKSLLDVE